MKNSGWRAYVGSVFAAIVGFFALADSKTFQSSVWQPISEHTATWSADDWNTVVVCVIGLTAGVWLMHLVKEGRAVGGLSSPLWFLAPTSVILSAIYQGTKWLVVIR